MKMDRSCKATSRVRHYLSLKDVSSKELTGIIKNAIKIKNSPEKYLHALNQKTLIMLFQKTSTRTRLSFEAGMTQLGGHAIFLDARTTQTAISDFLDEIRAMVRFGDLMVIRALQHKTIENAVSVSRIPIINGLCEKYHPCQGTADVMTIAEKSGGVNKVKNKKIVYLGIGNNVSNSLTMACTKLGAHITLCTPERHKPSYDPELVKIAKSSGLYEETTDVSCIKDADFVYTDTWIDMEYFDLDGNVIESFRQEYERRKKVFLPYQLNKKLLQKYNSRAFVMHDMPMHVGYEITRDVIESKRSIIFDQAENRLHAQKALMLWLLNKA